MAKQIGNHNKEADLFKEPVGNSTVKKHKA